MGAAVRFAANVYANHKVGKRIWKGEYAAQDWKELGVDVAEGSALGGVSAAAIYALTNYAELAAPFAGAMVSSALAVGALTRRYYAQEITFDEFCELGQAACLEGAVVGLAAALGQALIPVPLLGAVVGSVAGRVLVSVSKNLLAEDSRQLRERLGQQYERSVRHLEQASQEVLALLLAKYDALGELTACAFDFEKNVQLRFGVSVRLARTHGVEGESILCSITDVDAFFTS